jgi:Arc/MetJ-type ribon-helix-helix transcriptional regulator
MNMKTLTVSITPEHNEFIQSQLESGRYPSALETIFSEEDAQK